MGGVVNITLREEDGTLHKLSRYTNSTPHLIDNMGLIEKDPSHINEIVNEFSAPSYASQNGFCPEQYGLVVLDLKDDEIIHSQGYTSYGFFHVSGLQLDIRGNVIGGTAIQRFREFYENDRISEATPYPSAKGDISIDIDTSVAFEEFIKKNVIEYSKKQYSDDLDMPIEEEPNYFVIDTSPFEIIRFGESEKDIVEMKNYLESKGFVFTDEEEKHWMEFIK